MENTLLNRTPIAVGELRGIRGDTGEISDFEWLDLNAAGNAILGLDCGEIKGQRMSQMVKVFRKRHIYQMMLAAIATQKHVEDITPIGYNGGPFSGKSFYVSVLPQGDTITIAAHEATKLQARSKETSDHFLIFRELVNNSAAGAVVTCGRGEIVYANPAILRKLGWSLDEMIGHNLMRFIHPDGRQKAIDGALLIMKDEEYAATQVDIPYRHRDGSKILFSCVSSGMTNPSTGEYCYVTQYRDVGEEREISKQLKAAMIQAEAASKMKSEFLANMSHEIRTPLNGVIGMAQVLSNGDLSEDQREQVSTIIDSGTTLMSLLNDILDLSKIEAGQLDIALVPCDVRHKLGHVHQLFDPIANEKQIAFKFYVDPNVPTFLKIDPVRVRQCLSNLISNAMKFTHEGSVTTVITAERQGENHHMVKIFVSDTGTGIPVDKQDQIFLDFQQADGSTTRKYGGTGLGLSVTRSLARLMGGEITLSSQAGKGSVFILTFLAGNALADENSDSEVAEQIAGARGLVRSPAQQPSKPANALEAAYPAMANTPSPPPGQIQIRPATAQQPVRLNGMKVLMVDDNIVNRRVLRALLDEHEFEFTEAENGQIALDVMAQTAFDLVLLDVNMPVLDGVETIKAIRQSEVLHHTPVIALTANAMIGDREKYTSLGMDGYVSKPVNYDELMAEINRVVQERHTLRAAS